MLSGKRVFAAAVGALAALALAGCGNESVKVSNVGAQTTPTQVGVGAQTTPAQVGDPEANRPAPPSAAAVPVKQQTVQLNATAIPQMGNVVTDDKGWIYYRFDKDTAQPPKSNCDGTCAQNWPPALTDGNPVLQGISPDKVGTVTRSDGSLQITIGGWPIYRYAGDLKPGQWKGQGVGGTWFVVAPDGKKNLSCLPTAPPPPVAPPAGDSGGAGY